MRVQFLKQKTIGTAAAPRTRRKTRVAGFSLIELLVSMALFIVVLTMGVGALLVLINANAKAQNTEESVSNVQFALDSMAREIRTGLAYYCSTGAETTGDVNVRQNCNKGTYLSIIEGGKSLTENDSSNSNKRIAYCYQASSQAIYRKLGTGSGSCGTGSWVRLTTPNVKVTAMHFNVAGAYAKGGTGNADSVQPNVTIYIAGSVTGVSGTGSDFALQTTVTQRVLDL